VTLAAINKAGFDDLRQISVGRLPLSPNST